MAKVNETTSLGESFALESKKNLFCFSLSSSFSAGDLRSTANENEGMNGKAENPAEME